MITLKKKNYTIPNKILKFPRNNYQKVKLLISVQSQKKTFNIHQQTINNFQKLIK